MFFLCFIVLVVAMKRYCVSKKEMSCPATNKSCKKKNKHSPAVSEGCVTTVIIPSPSRGAKISLQLCRQTLDMTKEELKPLQLA